MSAPGERTVFIVRFRDQHGSEYLREWFSWEGVDPLDVLREVARAMTPDDTHMHFFRFAIRRDGEPWDGKQYIVRPLLDLEVVDG